MVHGIWGGSRYDVQLQDLRTERQAAIEGMLREMTEQREQIQSTSDAVAESLRAQYQAEVAVGRLSVGAWLDNMQHVLLKLVFWIIVSYRQLVVSLLKDSIHQVESGSAREQMLVAEYQVKQQEACQLVRAEMERLADEKEARAEAAMATMRSDLSRVQVSNNYYCLNNAC